MTPEERIERIEKALDRHIEFVGTQIEKQNEGIRDLITVSRTLFDAQTHTDAQIKELSQAQKHTDEKLKALIDTVHEHEGKIDALIDTVDKIIRQRRNGNEK